MNRSPYKLRLIATHEIKNKDDVAAFLAKVDEQCEHVEPFELLHSFTPHPATKAFKVRTYLKVEKEEDSGRDTNGGRGRCA